MRREQVTVGRKPIGYLLSEAAAPAVRQRPVRTVVFLHAFPLQAAMWEANLGALPEGWRGIAPDLRGFGQTPLPDEGPHRISDFAGDVVDLLDRLDITNAVAVGCSMGGYVLFEMIKSAAPYVSGAVFVSTRAGADSEEGKAARSKMIDRLEQEGVEAIANDMVPKLLGATSQREQPELVKQVRNLIVSNRNDGIATAVRAMMGRNDSTPLLNKIAVPTLVVAGAEDALIPPAAAEEMHRAIARSAIQVVPMAGHLLHLEQAGSFNDLLWKFLQAL